MILMIFIHERLWQVRPSEVVVLAVEHLFCRSSLVVVQYDFLVGHVPVVGQYAAVCILAVEEVKLLALLLTLPLYMICSPLPVPLCHAAQCPHLGHGYADAR